MDLHLTWHPGQGTCIMYSTGIFVSDPARFFCVLGERSGDELACHAGVACAQLGR